MNWCAMAAALIGGLVLAAPQGRAAEYPARAIKLIVPYPAGGPTDVLGRMVGEYLSRDLKQPVVIENKAGAQGAIGADAVAHAEADGYTLLFTASSVLELNPMLYKKLSYDPERELWVLAIVTDLPGIMIVHPSVPAQSIADFVVYAKQNPGKLNFGSAGTGGVGHLSGEIFKLMAGIEMIHVPYKGAGPALADVISGHIQATFETLGTALPPINAGLLRPLGATSPERIADLPDLPTIAESGYPGFYADAWSGLFAPRGTPRAVVDKLAGEVQRILRLPDVRERFAGLGAEPVGSTPAEFAAHVRREIDKWARVVKASGAKVD